MALDELREPETLAQYMRPLRQSHAPREITPGSEGRFMIGDTLLQNIRYTFRTFRRDAGLTVFVILIAGCGIGANSTVFSVVNTLLVRPLPFSHPEQLVWIANRDTSGLSGQTTQVGHMLDLRERTLSLSALTGYFAFYGVGDHIMKGLLRRPGDPAAAWPDLQYRRDPLEWSEGRALEPSTLAAAIRIGSGYRRHGAAPQRRTAHNRGRAAGVVRFRLGVRTRQSLRSVFPVPAIPGDQPLRQHHGHDRPAET